MKRVLITGATGMVGKEVLKICLASESIETVTSLVRRSVGITHEKLTEVLIEDFLNYEDLDKSFADIDIAIFCIGVYTGQVPDQQFKVITVDYAVSFAEKLKDNSPGATLCLLSGTGADRTEKSRVSFAKYKGIAENKLADIGLGSFHSFRPGYIYPVEKRTEPNILYAVFRFIYPLVQLLSPSSSIKSTELAEAMVRVGLEGTGPEVLENKDILQLLKD